MRAWDGEGETAQKTIKKDRAFLFGLGGLLAVGHEAEG